MNAWEILKQKQMIKVAHDKVAAYEFLKTAGYARPTREQVEAVLMSKEAKKTPWLGKGWLGRTAKKVNNWAGNIISGNTITDLQKGQDGLRNSLKKSKTQGKAAIGKFDRQLSAHKRTAGKLKDYKNSSLWNKMSKGQRQGAVAGGAAATGLTGYAASKNQSEARRVPRGLSMFGG